MTTSMHALGIAWLSASLAAVLALAALLGLIWYMFRIRADRRLRAALDRYAQQEAAKQIPAQVSGARFRW